ncbi:MAG: hypothetical protein IJO68_02255 [Clostridia bacterium]|nr:hypothetical protein [Clostridia bacterium]
MKTDKEMTQDILNHVKNIKKERTIMKKRIYKLTAISCAFAMIFIAAFAFFNTGINTLPDNSNNVDVNDGATHLNRNFFVMVANAADHTETLLNKEANTKIPLGGILMVEDTTDMSNSEKDAVMLNLKSRLSELYGLDKGWYLVGSQEEPTIYFGTADYLKIKVEDANSVENVIISCTEKGKITISDKSLLGSALPSEYITTVKQGTSITLTGKEYKEIYGKDDGMTIDWFLSESMKDTFKSAPETPLSSVNDIITVTINFVDGTNETFAIELNFDDEGILSSTYKG